MSQVREPDVALAAASPQVAAAEQWKVWRLEV